LPFFASKLIRTCCFVIFGAVAIDLVIVEMNFLNVSQ
jgi:hypothetical protein